MSKQQRKKEPFVMVPIWIIKSEAISKHAKSLYIYLKCYYPTPFPSIKTIQRHTYLHKNTIHKAFKELEKLELLKIIRRQGYSNQYELNPNPVPIKPLTEEDKFYQTVANSKSDLLKGVVQNCTRGWYKIVPGG